MMTCLYVKAILLLLVLVMIVEIVRSEFVIGKVPPGSNLDLTMLNGYYQPEKAAEICDQNKICAGFTYRGLLNSTAFPDRKYEMYFFRYIHQINSEAHYTNWVTYKTKKLFGEYYGIFSGRTKTLTEESRDYEGKCLDKGYPAITVYVHNGVIREQYKTIDLSMEEFIPSDDIRTLFNFETEEDNVMDVSSNLDTCCPTHDKKFNVTEFIETVNDTLPRISCDTDPKEFMEKYIIPRKPVMITGCIDSWTSTKQWTFENLLMRYGDDMVWRTDVSLDEKSPIDEKSFNLEEQYDDTEDWKRDVRSYGNLNLPGRTILELMRSNVTVRVFERVGTPPRRPRVESGNKTHKPDLFSEWSWPKAIPEDLYKPTFGGSDYQWVIMSQASTGTHIHHDPEITEAWNALLYGHKYWVILPMGVYVGNYECDMRCSPQLDELYAVSWYNHVLPQLRKETWYGKKAIETIQRPGEIIFVPNGMGHSVLNLDENLSITENFLTVAAIDELAQYHAYNWNPLSYESQGAATRVWRNLMNTNLSTPEIRRFGNAMLKQARTIKAEDIPEMEIISMDDYMMM